MKNLIKKVWEMPKIKSELKIKQTLSGSNMAYQDASGMPNTGS